MDVDLMGRYVCPLCGTPYITVLAVDACMIRDAVGE